MVFETDDESLPQEPSSSRQDNNELGKYHIEKRRLVQRHEASQSDQQPEFTADEDDSVDEEEASGDEVRSKINIRRSFWLSKGVGVDGADDSS